MIYPAIFNQAIFLYAFGNTPAVSLTQDLPPEQDADILLLGCGDARNILFTCFADTARKIDVTCCDLEPLVQARNVLLYSLLIDDSDNVNFEQIWSIYYDWKIDAKSFELLETQAEKLLKISETIEQWHGSEYGSTIRFCDEKSLLSVRSHWSGFTSKGLSPSEKTHRLKQLQSAIDRAKFWRNKGEPSKETISFFAIHSSFPTGFEAVEDVNDVSNYWWDCGTLPSSKAPQKRSHLNPALLYSPNAALTLSCMLHPLQGIPVSIAFTPITKGSAYHIEYKDKTSPEYLVDCAKNLFKQWASAFRRAVANKSMIRIFCGDALDFSFTLRNVQLKSTSMLCNLSASPVQLYRGDYGKKNVAPVSFDVVDTSNLADSLGPLNLIPITSSLLKYHASSCLYTELLMQNDKTLIDRLNGFFGVDVRTMALLLGLVEPHTFTDGMNSFEEDPIILALIGDCNGQSFARSRLRWRRLKGSRESGNIPYIHVEETRLSNFLFQLHYAMFRHEDLAKVMSAKTTSFSASYAKANLTFYNRASFASLINFLKTTVITDWDACIAETYIRMALNNFTSKQPTLSPAYKEDLFLSMHNYGVDSQYIKKPTRADVEKSALASVLPCMDDLPEQLCVTVRVPRKQLSVYTKKTPNQMGTPAIECSFKSEEWHWYFSTVKMTFGTWHGQTKKNLYPYIEEDCSKQSGTSDMFVSVMVPSKMLLEPKQTAPSVQCHLVPTMQTLKIFSREFGNDLCFARFDMTSKNVYITRYMPGMSALLTVAPNICRNKPSSAKIMVELECDGSKVKSLTQRVSVKRAKAELVLKSPTVEVKFKSPFTAVMIIGQSEELEFKFPVPVSPTNYEIKIDKKASCVKIKSPLFDPLGKDAASFLFPTFLMETSGGIVPTSWTSTRIDLDVMPPVDLTEKCIASWIVTHAGLMFSTRELSVRLSNISAVDTDEIAKVDIRTDLKDGLFSILMHYTGLTYQQADFFALSKKDKIQTFIFPSCLRLDLVNQTVVLDAAVIPLTETVLRDPRAEKFIQELTKHDLCQVRVSEVENRAWNAMMPALVERCRTAATWKHSPDCEYVQAGEVPLSKGLTEDGVSPICSCGVGKFPAENYLQSQMKRLPDLSYMVSQYATRAAIGLIFPVPYVEDCYLQNLSDRLDKMRSRPLEEIAGFIQVYGVTRSRYNEGKCVLKDKCVTCGRYERAIAKGSERHLLVCSKCRLIKYCSVECQKVDWKKHKHLCSATRKMTIVSKDGSSQVLYFTR